jgi:hypothetical protein
MGAMIRLSATAALAVPLVQQPLVWFAAHVGLAPWRAFDLAAVPPFGIPALLIATLWGGAWGLLLAVVRRRWANPGWPTRLALCALISLATVLVYTLLFVARRDPLPPHPTLAAVVGLAINAAWLTLSDWIATSKR